MTEIGEEQKSPALTEVLPTYELRSDFADLLQKTESKLSAEQRQEAREFLIRYTGLFAETNFDFGRTGIFKHHTETGDSRPINQ